MARAASGTTGLAAMGDQRYEFLDYEPPAPRGRRRRPARRRRSCLGRLVSGALTLLLAALIAGTVSAAGGYLYLSQELAGAIDRLATFRSAAGGTPRFYDRHGQLLIELKTPEKRRALAYADIPAVVKQATIAVEDDTFWDNWGIDPAAIGAAILYNSQTPDGRPVGASTITQQLVRHVAFSYEERTATSYRRKLHEIFLAVVLTRQKSKEDILTLYLNEIYYGNRAYGIEAAAQTYFGRPAAELTLAEAALLAGLPQAPAVWDPYTNFDGARERQRLILDLMAADGMITPAEAEAARGAPLVLRPLLPAGDGNSRAMLAPHFVLYVQREIEKRFGPDALFQGGWQVTTSLDLRMQQLAEEIARQRLLEWGAAHDASNAAVVVLKPHTSEILAMVGSLNYFDPAIDGQVNMAIAPRQPGSAFKPITYVAAMEKGWSTADVLWDVPIELEVGYDDRMIPVNYDGRYHGPLLLRDALANSYNIPPLQLARDVGLPHVIATARKMGVTSLVETPGYYGLSLTLGGGEIPLLELTQAFATLANGGGFTRLSPILKITDSNGRVVTDDTRGRLPPNRVVNDGMAYLITDILDDDRARVPAFGRGSALELPFPAAVKTGTTNDFRDNLTVGYTPGVVVGVWVGNSDSRPMRATSGLQGAAPIWSQLMRTISGDAQLLETLAVNGRPVPTEFARPASVIEREVCLPQGSGGSTCGARRTELMLNGAPIHGIGRLGYTPDSRSVPGAWQLNVLPLSAEAAAQILQAPLENGAAPPRPALCVTNRLYEGATTRLFLPPPPFYPDEVRARLWAERNGWGGRMAPPAACPTAATRGLAVRQPASQTAGAESEAAGGSAAPLPASNRVSIASPAPGSTLNGVVSIVGTVDPAEMSYYKLEIGRGASPDSWTTFGTTHSGRVREGVLETLQAGALPAGEYVIRLVVVKADGNYGAVDAVPVMIAP